MIKEIAIYPLMAVLFLGFAMQLVDVAESTSDKALSFSYDMEKAVDCATRGVDLRECSPNLYDYNFKEDINKTIELNKDIAKELRAVLKGSEYKMHIEEDVIYLELE